MGERELDNEKPGEGAIRDLSTRVADNEGSIQEIRAKLIEQEHRAFSVLRNFFIERKKWPEGDPRRDAAFKALLWRIFFSPGTAAAVGGVIAIMSLIALATQIYLQDQANRELRTQFELRRRTELVAILWDRSGPNGCPSINARMRSEALIEFVSGERIRGAEIDLTFSQLSDVVVQKTLSLAGADLTAANLHRAQLPNVDLRSARLAGAKMASAGLAFANLEHANLQGATATFTNLQDTNLRGALLNGGKFYGADLSSANLDSAVLIGADLRNALLVDANLNNTDLSGCLYDLDTNWPSSFDPISAGCRLVKEDMEFPPVKCPSTYELDFQ